MPKQKQHILQSIRSPKKQTILGKGFFMPNTISIFKLNLQKANHASENHLPLN